MRHNGDVFHKGRTVYPFIKTHNALTGGLGDALADLGQHFARAKPAKADKLAGP